MEEVGEAWLMTDQTASPLLVSIVIFSSRKSCIETGKPRKRRELCNHRVDIPGLEC
jgi:hypothetical protein